MSPEITKEQWAIADSHNIPRVTVYKRLQRGWDLERAITTPPKSEPRQERSDGRFSGDEKGKPRSIRLPKEWDEELDQAIAESGMSQSDWIAEVIVNKLKRNASRRKNKWFVVFSPKAGFVVFRLLLGFLPSGFHPGLGGFQWLRATSEIAAKSSPAPRFLLEAG